MARSATVTVGRISSAGTGLGEFDDLLENRLPNWGKWGRHDPDKPNPNNCGYSLCRDYIPRGDERGWDDSSVEPYSMPIRVRDAEEMDVFLFQMIRKQPKNFKTIANRFYKRRPVAWDDLADGIRGLMDLMESNRIVVAVLRRYGYR